MLPSFFLPSLEKAVNRYLALDPESPKLIQNLTGKIITIELLPFHTCLQLRVEDNKIKLTKGELLPAELKLSATPLNFVAFALSRDKNPHFFAETVVLEGNAELGMQVIGLFDQLEIDWEEYLAEGIGDVPAHQLGRFAKGLLSWGKEATASLRQNVTEYLHEEKCWLPPQELLEDFFSEIDELRLATDRLEAKVQNLEKSNNEAI